MLEPEVAFANLNDVAGLAEAMLKYVFKAVLEERADDMQFFAERVDKDAIDRLQRFITADFAQVDYTDAVTILENCGKQFENPVFWGVDLSSEHERYLAEEHFKAPVVVKNYPKDIKAFYMRLTKTVKPSRQWTFWRRASARLSAVPSVKSVSTCLTRVWQRWGLTKKTTGGIATCVATARAAFRLRSGLRTPHRLRHRRAERPRCYSVPRTPRNATF
ncbi:asparaginyl-tRNA synthetase [Klebsiella pneumoniae]|nr:asparaginyl-tRNA synthetase [Klebsiella pneumoniae]